MKPDGYDLAGNLIADHLIQLLSQIQEVDQGIQDFQIQILVMQSHTCSERGREINTAEVADIPDNSELDDTNAT